MNSRRVKSDHSPTGRDQENPDPMEPARPPTRAERVEQLLLVGGLSPTGIRARLIEEGIVTRVSLATVERDIEAVLTRWRSKAVVSVTDAALRHLGRYRDLYQRALAVADSAASPREVLSALALAGKFSDSEAKLLGAATRDTGHDWLSNALEARERALEARAKAEAAEAEREWVLRHNQTLAEWESRFEEQLGSHLEAAFESEEAAFKQLRRAVFRAMSEHDSQEIEVPEDDPWSEGYWGETEFASELDPRTVWSAVARESFGEGPLLERLQEALRRFVEPPGYPGPWQPPREQDIEDILSSREGPLPRPFN